MSKLGLILALVAMAMLAPRPSFAVTGEVNVAAGGKAVPGAQVALEIDGEKIKAKADPKRQGTYVFDVTEEQAKKPAKLHVTKDGKTTTEDIAPIAECPSVDVGGKKRCVLETVLDLAPLIEMGVRRGIGFGFGGGGGGLCVVP